MKINNTSLKNFSLTKAKGFTLIELVVVIAILGVLATVLITLIDPVDKINLANDTGAISQIRQLGSANDAYASQHSNSYTSGMATACTAAGAGLGIVSTNPASPGNFAGAVLDLCAAGEIKTATLTAPSGYAYLYWASASAGAFLSCNDTAVNCANAQFGVLLKSKKYTGQYATPYYVYSNGKGCIIGTAPTAANIPLC